ncbi:MAG: hypothetical protein IJ466_11720 [Clostridia bacterium]|nr:hypothetical protein [Clostridia bacterium]
MNKLTDLNSISVNDMELSTRATNILLRHKLKTAEEVSNLSAFDFQFFRNCGVKTIIEIDAKLQTYGARIRDMEEFLNRGNIILKSETTFANFETNATRKALNQFKRRLKTKYSNHIPPEKLHDFLLSIERISYYTTGILNVKKGGTIEQERNIICMLNELQAVIDKYLSVNETR